MNIQLENIEKLRNDWTLLSERAASNNLFLSWEWIYSWCQIMLDKSETPIIITARQNERLIGIAPLIIIPFENGGELVRFIGQSHSYYQGFIAENGIEEQVYNALWDHLLNKVVKKLYAIEFLNVKEDEIFESVLKNQAEKRGFIVDKVFVNPSKVITLPEKFEDYLKEGIKSVNLRKTLNRKDRKLKKEYGVKFFHAEESDFQKYWTEMIKLRTIETQHRFNHSVLYGHPFFAQHLKNVAQIFEKRQALRLGVLMINNEIAAIIFAISFNRVYYDITISLNSGLFHEIPWLGVCIYTNLQSIKCAIAEGCIEFDFLPGVADYKYKMGGKERALSRFFLYQAANSNMAPKRDIDKIETQIETIGQLQNDWPILIQNSGNNNLFLSWEWIYSWCQNMLPSASQPMIITIRNNSMLIGLAPLVKTQADDWRTIIKLLGQEYSYHLGFIAEKGREEQVYHAIWDYLFDVAVPDFRSIEFIHFDEDVIFNSVLTTQTEKRQLIFEKGFQNPCKVVALPETFDEYLKSGIVSHNLKRNIAKDFRKLGKECQVEFFQADKDNFNTYWFQMIDLHREMIKNKNKYSVLFGEQFPQHLQQVAGYCLKNNALRLNILKVNQQTAGVLLGIIHNDTFNALTMGVNINLIQELPWLNVVITSHVLSIKFATADKCKKYDFLGGHHDYKYKLGGVDTGGVKIMVHAHEKQSGQEIPRINYASKMLNRIKSFFQVK